MRKGTAYALDHAKVTNRLAPSAPLSGAINLGAADTLKIILTTQEGKEPKRPHQAFLSIQNTENGLETSYPLSMKENGKGRVELVSNE